MCLWGISLTVIGQVSVRVAYKAQKEVLPLIVVEGSQGCPTLMDRDWLCKIRLNWQELFMVSHRQGLDSVLEKHGEVFKPKPQGCKAEVSLVVKPDVPPKFSQPDQSC